MTMLTNLIAIVIHRLKFVITTISCFALHRVLSQIFKTKKTASKSGLEKTRDNPRKNQS